MKFSKHIQKLSLFLVLFPACLLGMEHTDRPAQKAKSNDDVSLYWVEVTSQNISTQAMETFFNQLEPIYISAFKKLTMACMQQEHPEKYQAMIAKGETVESILAEEWKRSLGYLNMFLTKGMLKNILFAVIKNTKSDILGFSIFLPISQKLLLDTLKQMGRLKQIEWVKEGRDATNLDNEVFGFKMALNPDFQGRGLGKKLAFSILEYPGLPRFKKIHAATSASKENAYVQNLYARYGLEWIAIYTNNDGDQDRIYEFNAK